MLALKAQGRCEPVAVCDVYRPAGRRRRAADRRQNLSQLQGTAGRSAGRRGVHRHARPASCPAGDRRDPRRQGRVLREAADALVADGPGQAARRRGREARADRAGGHAVRRRRRLRQGPQADQGRGRSARSCTCRRAISAAAIGASGCRSPIRTPSPAPISIGSSSSATPRSGHFDVSRFFQWRLYWDYAGGPATDLLVHVFTPVFCLLDLDFPERVMGGGGTFQYNREVPDQCNIIADYAGGPSVVLMNSLSNFTPHRHHASRHRRPDQVRRHRAPGQGHPHRARRKRAPRKSLIPLARGGRHRPSSGRTSWIASRAGRSPTARSTSPSACRPR